MAQTPEDSGDDSKLELPSLRIFRRRKKQSDAEESPADDVSDDTRTETPGAPATEPSVDADAAEESPAEESERLAELGSEADEPDVEEPATLEETQPVQAAEPVETPVDADVPPAVEEAEPEPEPAAEVEAGLGTMFPNAVVEADEADEAESGDEPTQTLPAHDVPEADDASEEESTKVSPVAEQDDTSRAPQIDQFGEDESAYADAEADELPLKRRKELTLPTLDPRIAAPVTGLAVGLAGVALTFIGQRGCEAVKGTGSCGGVGLFLLIAILALMILLGATLLRAWRISDPTNSSFLAVGLVAVIAMLFFLPSIDTWYMVIVIPVLCALTYLLSWWVTHTFIENADEENADQT